MKTTFTAAIAAAALIAASLATAGSASAKPMKGPHPHHHHGWGGSVFVAGGGYEDCYLVKRYDSLGRPYFVQICA